jgi:Protein of unknown function (DUF3987)
LDLYCRVALIFDEFRRFDKKANIEGSVLGSIINELSDGNTYANYTKTDQLEIRNGHLGVLANTTEESFLTLVSAPETVGSGFLNRFFLVIPGADRKRVSRPEEPEEMILGPIRTKLAESFAKLPPLTIGGKPQEEIVIGMTPNAEQIWTDYYDNLEETDATARLDNIGMRLMGVLAFTSGKQQVDENLVRSVLDILEYQRTVREIYYPAEAVTRRTKIGMKILSVLRQRGPMTSGDIRRYTNADREDPEMFKSVMDELVCTGLVVAAIADPAKPTVGKKYALARRTVEPATARERSTGGTNSQGESDADYTTTI